MKNLERIKKGFVWICVGILTLSLILLIILLSLRISEENGGQSIWSSASFQRFDGEPFLPCYCAIFLICLGVNFVLYLLNFLLLYKKKIVGLILVSVFDLLYTLFILFVHVWYDMLSVGAIVLSVFNLMLMVVILGLSLIYKIKVLDKEAPAPYKSASQAVLLALSTLGIIILLSTLFVPLCTKTAAKGSKTTYILIQTLFTETSAVEVYFMFIGFFLADIIGLLYYCSTIPYFFSSKGAYLKKSKRSVYINSGITLVFFLVGYFNTFYYNVTSDFTAQTISYIPFLLMIVLWLAYSFIEGRYLEREESTEKLSKKKQPRIEPLIFIGILTAITFSSILFKIINVEFLSTNYKENVSLTGIDLLKDYASLTSGYQQLTFIIFTFLLTSGLLFVLTLVSFFTKSKDYQKWVKLTAFVNVFYMLLLALFGVYYKIAQKTNEEQILNLLKNFGYNISSVKYTYTIKSQSFYPFILSLLAFVIMMIRGHLNISAEPIQLPEEKKPEGTATASGELALKKLKAEEDFDACPAFTELDMKQEEYEQELRERLRFPFKNPSLPAVVRFIVDYARESRLHLSYTLEDIAAFVSGLGASRLAILQGMSGTGKTSLPKIFTEAIMGKCEIIEVESSWRDKNELLGYYNEFSKRFTPKKFTQSLYKAKLNPEIPTFIVLDEMNLSRIEYYFSDFLSLMENEEDKREIKLLNIKLFRTENQEISSYCGLTEGHTLKIPTNVWFIGTANRDASTFEISDKVYDRAMTMNFNKRAAKIHTFSEELPPKFLSYSVFVRLLNEAKAAGDFDAEGCETIQRVEKLLEPYNISFGNRILKQMEDFVNIYCACFGDKQAALKDAVERILLSKVVSKLEFKNIEDKDSLIKEFDRLRLFRCSEFIKGISGE